MDTKQDSVKRINKVISYIDKHLDKGLTIDELSEVAFYSKFHFNRTFKSLTGESVYQYIKRLRLERACYYLWESGKSVTEIAVKCGFSTTSNFSYNYRRHFGISPKEQRVIDAQNKKESKIVSLDIHVKELKEMNLAYIHSIGSCSKDIIVGSNKLFSWSDSRGYFKSGTKFVLIGYDCVWVTKQEHIRKDVCIQIPEDAKISDDVSFKRVASRKVASLHVRTNPTMEALSDDVDNIASWVLKSGYRTVVEIPTIFLFDSMGSIKSTDIIDVEICVPIEPK